MADFNLRRSNLQRERNSTNWTTTGKYSIWEMYRRKLKVLNRNKLIVFINQHFGIFPSHEVFMLADVPVHDIAEEFNITREQVYAKYTDQTIAENS